MKNWSEAWLMKDGEMKQLLGEEQEATKAPGKSNKLKLTGQGVLMKMKKRG